MKPTHRFLLALAMCIPILVQAQTGYADAGSRSNAMGNASVTNVDVYSAQNNQAALGYLESGGAGISTENYFLIDSNFNNDQTDILLRY